MEFNVLFEKNWHSILLKPQSYYQSLKLPAKDFYAALKYSSGDIDITLVKLGSGLRVKGGWGAAELETAI